VVVSKRIVFFLIKPSRGPKPKFYMDIFLKQDLYILISLDLKTNRWEELELKVKPGPRSGHRMALWKVGIILHSTSLLLVSIFD